MLLSPSYELIDWMFLPQIGTTKNMTKGYLCLWGALRRLARKSRQIKQPIAVS